MFFKAYSSPSSAGLIKTLRIMQLTAIFLLAACLTVSAKVVSQKVTLSEKDASLEKVFREIERQTGFSFLYENRLLQNAKKISITVNAKLLPEVLEECMRNQPLSYKIFEKTVVIAEKPTAELQPADAFSSFFPPPPIDVHGKVVNESGEPIEGVTVTVKGTKNATATNANGEFTLTGVDEKATLVFTSTNVETYEMKVNGKPDMGATLKTKVTALQDVVINKGYYSVKQKENTGDISTVSAKDIEKQPVSSPLAAIEGRVSGMIITQTNGVPGGGYTVQIRGQNSIANGNDPLYVIDGVPYFSRMLQSNGANILGGNSINGTVSNPLNFINPSDIESIDILKDADATAIYGSRGANGVILITTKRGKSGDTQINFNVYTGVGQVANFMDLMNTTQYVQMRKEGYKNDGLVPSATTYDVNGTWDTTRYTNWQKTLFGSTAQYRDIQGSINGGNTNTQYLIGMGYHKETTVFPGDFADQKASVHFNVNSVSNNQRFKNNLSVNYIADINHLPYADLANYYNTSPDAPPLYDAAGNLNFSNSTFANPLSQEIRTFKVNTYNLISNDVLSYKLSTGLEFKTNLGYTNMQINEVQQIPITASDPAAVLISGNSLRSASFTNNNIQSWVIEPQINYSLKTNKGKFSALIGSSIQRSMSLGQIVSGSTYNSDALLGSLLGAATITKGATTNTQYKYNAIYARVNYTLKDKYILNVTARRDGSSRFGPGSQFANFGAIGGAWIFGEEKVIKDNLPFLSFGKLRVSYGTTGNDQIGDYKYLDLYTSTTNPYQATQGLIASGLYNLDYGWETTRKLEGGIDFGFFKDKLVLNISYFQNRSSNELIQSPLSSVTGGFSIIENLPATVQNTGLEVNFNTLNVKIKKFSWSSSINLTIPGNKLIAYPNLATSSNAYNWVIGQPITNVRLYHFGGVNTTTGVYQFADGAGGMTYTPPSYDPLNPSNSAGTTLVNLAPKFYGGIQNNFSYKGFELTVFFQFVKQIVQNPIFIVAGGYPGFGKNNMFAALTSRWQNPGDVTNIQKFSANDIVNGLNLSSAYNFARVSDYGYVDGSFIRLKNLAVSYHLPSVWAKKMLFKSLQIYLQGQNLLTITKYSGLDPETHSINTLPPLRVWSIGLRAGL